MKKLLKKLTRAGFLGLSRLESRFDRAFLVDDVPLSTISALSPRELQNYISSGNGAKLRILEIGSREVTGPSQAREQFTGGEYVGFDYYPGRNVDVVGDVHRLSSYFKEDEKFDIIYSIAFCYALACGVGDLKDAKGRGDTFRQDPFFLRGARTAVELLPI
jgi:hypothetical protein